LCQTTWSNPPGTGCPADGTPLQAIGTLTIVGGAASLDGTLLARSGPNPIGAAVEFLLSQGFQSGDRIEMTGNQSFLDNREVLYIETVRRNLREGTGAA